MSAQPVQPLEAFIVSGMAVSVLLMLALIYVAARAKPQQPRMLSTPETLLGPADRQTVTARVMLRRADPEKKRARKAQKKARREQRRS